MAAKSRWMSMGVGMLLCVVIAATAIAGNGLKKKTASTTIAGGETGSATAKCAKGTKAIAGGFAGPSEDPTSSGMEAHESRRTSGKNWATGAYNGSGDDTALTAFVYCRDEAIRPRSAETSIDATLNLPPELETGSAVAKCPRGTKVVSGGFDNPDFDYQGGFSATNIRPYRSLKVGKRKWEVSASNRSDTAGTLVVDAYCREGKALKTKQKSEMLPLGPGDFPNGSVIASCKKGQRAVSGGYASDEPGDFNGPFFYESRRMGKRKWVVSASANVSGPVITAYAYCEKK